MRFSRGVVKIPIKHIYFFLIVLASAVYVYLELTKYHAKSKETFCRITPPKATQKSTKNEDKEKQAHPGCSREPKYTKYEHCPSCFRSNLLNVSQMLHQVRYSTSMFPRGPPDFFKPRDTVQQELITDYLITPSKVCVDRCSYLVAVQLSVADEIDQRNSIRATWGSASKTRLWPHAYLNGDVQTVFVLAHQTELSHLHQPNVGEMTKSEERFPTLREWASIKTEADRYGDILYLNMQDSYYNLTLKLMSSFKWLKTHCSKTKFFLKVDVDTFVNIPLLMDLLIYQEERLDFSVIGQMYTAERVVHRAHKWTVDPKVYPPPLFPVYASDTAYILSANLLIPMLDVTHHLPLNQLITQLERLGAEKMFVTGLMGVIISYDFFTVRDYFTDQQDTKWYMCDLINDKKIIGKVLHTETLYKVWRSIFRFYGCAYVLSNLAVAALMDVFPFSPMFHIEDAYITGVLTRLAGIKMIAGDGGIFTHNIDYNWKPCELIHGNKLVGTGVTLPFKMINMWAGVVHHGNKCAQRNLLDMSCYCSPQETY